MGNIRLDLKNAADSPQLQMAIRVDDADPVTIDLNPLPFAATDLKDDLALLRAADPRTLTEQMVLRDADALSRWLLRPTLQPILDKSLAVSNDATGKRLRLIIGMDALLRGQLFDLPFELLGYAMDNPNLGLGLDRRMGGIIRYIPKPSAGLPTPIPLTWPLKILIVRCNPADLGGAVPPAAPVADTIHRLAAQANISPNMVQVDILSGEPNVVPQTKAVTWNVIRDQLDAQKYHILIYMGHGNLPQSDTIAAMGQLLLEKDDPQYSDPIEARRWAIMLHDKPVPVVLLVGCLTGAQVDTLDKDLKEFVNATVPSWMRGSQSVAQAVVDSDSGVQVAIGMRDRLETGNATIFLQGFFKSLLIDMPGDIEAAVCIARHNLFQANPHPPAWSSPALFSSLYCEPLLGFLKTPPLYTLSPDLIEKRKLMDSIRTQIWKSLASAPSSARTPELMTMIKAPLVSLETDWLTAVKAESALLMPGFAETNPNLPANLPVSLSGALKATCLHGQILLTGGANPARIVSINPASAVTNGGWRLLYNEDGYFRIERDGSDAVILPEGELFQAVVMPGIDGGSLYNISLSAVAEPSQGLVTGTNALIVTVA